MNNSLKFIGYMVCAVCAPSVYAQTEVKPDAKPDAFLQCAQHFSNNPAGRLKCFDNALGMPVSAPVKAGAVGEAPEAMSTDNYAQPAANVGASSVAAGRRTYLTRVWNLDNRPHRDQSSLDRLQLHRQNYLIVRKSTNPNNLPTSPGIGNAGVTPNDIDALEAKFRLSFKTSMYTNTDLDLGGFKTFRLWGAYTQQSSWQVFNTRNSSPFRETNYEPELIAAFATGKESGFKLLNLGLTHQSNGRPNPESRSWNRVYAQGGWEWDNTSLLARAWWRVPENILKDDNPDIVHYIGRAEVVARWEPDDRSQAVLVAIRNNLNLNQNIGFVQVDWSLPVALGTAARMHAQFTSGYGESLIDYNHRQNTFGLGFSFREW